MKFTHTWLARHLETSLSPQEIAAKLTAIGLEVESLSQPGKTLAPFITAEIVKADPHPNADRLRVCTVHTGTEYKQIVCGAPNARAGLKTVLGLPGTHVPGLNITLKLSKIRDVESQGMLCSAKELGIEGSDEGIMELPAEAPIGVSFADYARLNDTLYEIKLTPNRADCNGVIGIARDLYAAGCGALKPRPITPIKGVFESPIKVHLEAIAACPYFIGRAFRGVKNGPSPQWLQDLLRGIGLKPISALVDITNFLSFDAARPLHVFDASKLTGDIHARFAIAGEKLNALNGTTYDLPETALVIADDKNAHALAGIMGDMESGCSAETTDVFLECAYFNPSHVAAAGRHLHIVSDARYRFERGVDAGFMDEAVAIASALILECCGGEASSIVRAGIKPEQSRTITLRTERCKTLGGLDLPVAQQATLLQKIGCTVTINGAVLDITTPSWRADMEGEADCVEEMLRLTGFDAIAPAKLEALTAAPALSPAQKRVGAIKRVLAARGLLEAVTYSFMPSSIASAIYGDDQAQALTLLNPISADLDRLRQGLLPNLLQAAARNSARGFHDGALFEVGPVFHNQGQALVASGLRFGATPRHWAEKPRGIDAFDAKADALAVLEVAGVPMSNIQTSADGAGSTYHPGRSGTLRLGATILASFGEVHPALLKQLDAPAPAAAFDVMLEALPVPKHTSATKALADMPDLQPVTRDFAFIIKREETAEKLLRAVKGAEKSLISDAFIFDVYEGKGVTEGHKSLALCVTLQPRAKTLTDADLEAVSSKIIAAAQKATGAVLRG